MSLDKPLQIRIEGCVPQQRTSQKSGLSRSALASLGGKTTVIFASSVLSASSFSWLITGRQDDSCAGRTEDNFVRMTAVQEQYNHAKVCQVFAAGHQLHESWNQEVNKL